MAQIAQLQACPQNARRHAARKLVQEFIVHERGVEQSNG
jgi:hypothetical protein